MTRADVLREFTDVPGFAGLINSPYDHDAMADEIVRLRAALARMACPVCHEVNPAEVHTCTPAPKVTRVLDEYRIFDGYGHVLNTVEGTREYAHNLAQSYRIRPYTEHPVTVRRVALLEDNNNNN